MPYGKNFEVNTQRILEMSAHKIAHDIVEHDATASELKDDISLRVYFLMTIGVEVFKLQTQTMLMSALLEESIQVFQTEEDVRGLYAKMLNLSCDDMRKLITKEIENVKNICMKEGIKHDKAKH